MTIERIFAELHDWTTWPAPPERPLVPATLADMLAHAVDPAELVPWLPDAPSATVARREANEGWRRLKAG